MGPWRIVDLRGWGAYGAVYLAEGVEPETTGEVALKLALAPRDERFPREVGLLSRVSHPCIPRLIDQGQWLSPFGLPHPFVVMEWVHGLPLYVWAQDLNPSSRKVLGVLAEEAGPEADAPLFLRRAPRPVQAEVASQHSHPWAAEAVSQRNHHQPPPLVDAGVPPPHILRASPEPIGMEASGHHCVPPASQRSWRPWLATVGVLAVVAWVMSTSSLQEEAEQVPVVAQEEARDAGTVAVGDSAVTARVDPRHAPSAESPIAWDMPSEPLQGQIRPDARGRCPDPHLVPINGGCWRKVGEDPKDCIESEYSYAYKGACYMPAYRKQRPPTSSPTESRDGG